MKKLDMFFVIDEYFIICRWLQQLLWSSWRFKCKWLEEVGIKWGTRFVKTYVSINYFVRFFASNFDFPCNLLQNDTYKDVFLWVLRNVLRKPLFTLGNRFCTNLVFVMLYPLFMVPLFMDIFLVTRTPNSY